MIPYFSWHTISLGPLTLQVWGLWVAIGIAVSTYIIYRRSAAAKLPVPVETVLDIGIYILVGGFIGARLGHVLLYEPQFYFSQPAEILKVWQGGMSSFGGIFGAILSFFLAVKRKNITKDIQLKVAEIIGYSAIFGWILARVGCFFIHDHLGVPCTGNCFLAVNGPDVPRYDLSLLEILALLPLAVGFYYLRNKEKPTGWFLAVLMIYYGIVRFFLDFLRAQDIASADVRYFGLTPAQYLSIIMIFGGVYLYRKKMVLKK